MLHLLIGDPGSGPRHPESHARVIGGSPRSKPEPSRDDALGAVSQRERDQSTLTVGETRDCKEVGVPAIYRSSFQCRRATARFGA